MSFSKAVRGVLLSCITILSFTFSTIAQAVTHEQADQLLSTLHKMRVESFLAINAYYNFSNSNGDKSVAAEANRSINRIDSLLDQLNALPGAAEMQDDFSNVSKSWDNYRKLLITNMKDLINRGYPDLRLMVDMGQANVNFVGTLGQVSGNVKKVSGYQTNELLDLIRESTLKIEQIMTAYAARSASNVSQIAQGAETEEPLNVLAEQFSAQLDQLKSQATSNTDASQRLDDIITKWNFIKSSYINFNENNVAYIANLYSKKIIEGLIELENSQSQL